MEKFLDKFFGQGQRAPDPDFENIRFGRHNDFFKTPEQRKFLRQAERAFHKGDFLDSFELFLLYLLDPKAKNVSFTRTKEKIDYQIVQGSKMVRGTATADKVQAESVIAHYDKLSVAFMRKLLEMNYGLKYSSYALKGESIVLGFDTPSVDCLPDKLSFALKEVATKADKLDDLFVDEFSMLKNVDNSHIEEISPIEKELKFHFLHIWIKEKLLDLSKLDQKKYASLVSYSLLNLAYKIDYLLTPEGKLMDMLEKIHRGFFGDKGTTVHEKNELMIHSFGEILALEKEALFKELYRVQATFGLGSRVAPTAVSELIHKEMHNLREENYDYPIFLQRDKLEYIAQYCLFYYRMNQPTSELFHLCVELFNQDYFTAIGHPALVNKESKKVEGNIIRTRLREIEDRASNRYPQFNFDKRSLDLNHLLSFANTYYHQMRKLNFHVKLTE